MSHKIIRKTSFLIDITTEFYVKFTYRNMRYVPCTLLFFHFNSTFKLVTKKNALKFEFSELTELYRLLC